MEDNALQMLLEADYEIYDNANEVHTIKWNLKLSAFLRTEYFLYTESRFRTGIFAKKIR